MNDLPRANSDELIAAETFWDSKCGGVWSWDELNELEKNAIAHSISDTNSLVEVLVWKLRKASDG